MKKLLLYISVILFAICSSAWGEDIDSEDWEFRNYEAIYYYECQMKEHIVRSVENEVKAKYLPVKKFTFEWHRWGALAHEELFIFDKAIGSIKIIADKKIFGGVGIPGPIVWGDPDYLWSATGGFKSSRPNNVILYYVNGYFLYSNWTMNHQMRTISAKCSRKK